MRAKNKAGLPVPWLYIRDLLARRYGAFPAEIDEWCESEVETAITIMQLEDTNRPG